MRFQRLATPSGRLIIAGSYVVAVLALQLYAIFDSSSDAEGDMFILMFLTAPGSMVILQIADSLHPVLAGVIGDRRAFDVINASTLVVGVAMNAIIISGFERFLKWIRRSPVLAIGAWTTLVATAVVIVALLWPRLYAIEAERRRPINVPNNAVAWGSWAWHWCEISAEQKTHCVIWDRYGTVQYDEEFLPADGGPSVETSELTIVEDGGNGDQISLANGRVLWPRSKYENSEWQRRHGLPRSR